MWGCIACPVAEVGMMVTIPSLNSWISAGKKALCMIAHATRRWKVIAGMVFDNGTRDALLLKLVLSCRG